MARTKQRRCSYSAGEWGRNRVRIFPNPRTGLMQIEWREDGRRRCRSLGHRDWDRFIREWRSGKVGPSGRHVSDRTIERDLRLLLAVLNWAAKSRDEEGRYIYVSSRSAYSDLSSVPMTSGAPTYTYETRVWNRARTASPTASPRPVSEREAQRVFGDRANIVRPSLIIGPQNETDRFTYCPVRIHRGGEVLAPGDGSDTVKIICVRDLTERMIHMAETGHTGEYNGIGPTTLRPMTELLYGIRVVTTAETTFTSLSPNPSGPQRPSPASVTPLRFRRANS